MSGKVVVAAAVFVFGLGFVFWSWSQSKPPVVEQPEFEITETVQELLADDRFDRRPQRNELPDVWAAVQHQIEEEADNITQVRSLGAVSVQDLGAAFVERLQLMLVPEFERDYRASVARGDPKPRDEAYEKAKKAIEYFNENPPRLDMGLRTVEVSLLMPPKEDEVVSGRSWEDEGFGYLSSTRNSYHFPVPESPVDRGWLCVEVTMLLMQTDAITQRDHPAIVGYHFAWNAERSQWIPYQAVVYRSPAHVFAVPPL